MRQLYWNEYDNGSEADNEEYMIEINPDNESTFPGAATMAYVFSKAKLPMVKVKEWLSPSGSPEERRPLISNGNGGG